MPQRVCLFTFDLTKCCLLRLTGEGLNGGRVEVELPFQAPSCKDR